MPGPDFRRRSRPPLQLIPASAAMLGGSLGEALESDPPPFSSALEAQQQQQQRVVFLSGMYAAEVFEVIAAYRELGLPEAVFAAAVPKSWGRPLGELVEGASGSERGSSCLAEEWLCGLWATVGRARRIEYMLKRCAPLPPLQTCATTTGRWLSGGGYWLSSRSKRPIEALARAHAAPGVAVLIFLLSDRYYL